MKSLIRLLQDDGVESFTKKTFVKEDVVVEVLTLPALQAFVEGGEEYLARRANEAQKRQPRWRSGTSRYLQHDDPTAPSADSSRTKIITRSSSWSEEERDHNPDEEIPENKEQSEDAILKQLQVVLSRAFQDSTVAADGVGRGGREDMIEGYLKSFDLDDDGILSPQEFEATLRSLGGQGRNFGRRKEMKALVDRFSGGKSGVSIIEIARWFDSRIICKHDSTATIGGERPPTSAGRRGEAESRPNKDGSGQGNKHGAKRTGTDVADAPEQALQRAVRIAESKGTTLERTFARLDEDGDGFITVRQLLRGLDQMGVFEQVMQT